MVTRMVFVVMSSITIFSLFGFSQTVYAAPYVLDNSPGDGSIMVGVDGYGTFGSAPGSDSTDALYDPVGVLGPKETSFESAIALRTDLSSGARSFLTSGSIGGSGGLVNPAVSGTSTSGSSSFDVGDLSFHLSQTLTPTFSGGSQTGTILTQTYTITNTGSPIEFELIRYLDGDLQFVGGFSDDGGGRLIAGDGTEILFETDTATGSATATTFVGITGEGGTEPASNRYEIDAWPSLRNKIITGNALDDTIAGDGLDADEFIDSGPGYDVTLAFRNTFSLDTDETTVYQTRTIFGSGAPEDALSPTVIGGQILPINTASLLIAGIISNPVHTFSVFAIIGSVAYGALYLQKRRN